MPLVAVAELSETPRIAFLAAVEPDKTGELMVGVAGLVAGL